MLLPFEHGSVKRRAFFRALATLAGLTWAGAPAAAGPGSNSTIAWPGSAAPAMSEVVVVHHPGATSSFNPVPEVIHDMVRTGLAGLFPGGADSSVWKTLLRQDDRIGIKVPSAGGRTRGTARAVAGALIESLLAEGYPATNIVVWDRKYRDLVAGDYPSLGLRYGVRVRACDRAGYDAQAYYDNPLLGNLIYGDHEFGKKGEAIGRKSFVSRLLTHELTRIIVISPLSNHNGAGIAGALYGLATGSVDNTQRFEMNRSRLEVAVPEIFALKEVGDKLALVIMDALVCQYEGGATSLLHYSDVLNQLWFSRDPVASDVLGLAELQERRLRTGAPPRPLRTNLYDNAQLLELGQADREAIQVRQILLH